MLRGTWLIGDIIDESGRKGLREESIPPDGRKESDDCFDMVKFGE